MPTAPRQTVHSLSHTKHNYPQRHIYEQPLIPRLLQVKETPTMNVDQQQFLDNGYLIIRQCIPPDRLDELRSSFETLVDRQREIWARERGPDDPPGGVWETGAQPRVSFDEVVDAETANAVEFCLHENTLGVSRQLISGDEVAVHQLQLMCNPVSDHPGGTGWHRDTSPDWGRPPGGRPAGHAQQRPRLRPVEHTHVRRQRPLGRPGQQPRAHHPRPARTAQEGPPRAPARRHTRGS